MFVKGSLVQGIYPIKPLTKQFYRLNSSADYVYYANKIKKGKVNVKRGSIRHGQQFAAGYPICEGSVKR